METTDDLTPLGHQILEHWRKYRPKMVQALTDRNQLLPLPICQFWQDYFVIADRLGADMRMVVARSQVLEDLAIE